MTGAEGGPALRPAPSVRCFWSPSAISLALTVRRTTFALDAASFKVQ